MRQLSEINKDIEEIDGKINALKAQRRILTNERKERIFADFCQKYGVKKGDVVHTDLYGDMMTVLHGIYGNGSVKLPGDGEIDEVYVVEFAELLIAFFTGELMYGTRGAVLLKDRLGPVDAVLIKVAEGHKGCILKIRETVDGTGTAVSEAYKADPDVLDGLGPESEHGLLVRRTRRNVIDNLVVLD